MKNQYKGSSYDPIKDAGWKKSDKNIPYAAIAKTFDKISEKSGRLDKIELLSNFFRSVFLLHPHEFHWCVYLAANQVAPPYEGVVLGVGDTLIFKALQNSTGRKLSEMKAELHKCGDIGTVAINSRSKQTTLFKPKPLTVKKVFHDLLKVAKCSGNKSNDYKSGIINGLYVASKGTEAKFITRHLTGKMKLGLAELTVYSSIARACLLTPCATYPPIIDLSKKIHSDKIAEMEKEHIEIIKRVFSEMPNLERVSKALIEVGIDKLHNVCHLTPGIPVKAMLAKPTNGVQDILERFKDCKFTLEYKYDGERGQIHIMEDDVVKLFSRNAEDNTQKFPDLVSTVRGYMKEGNTSAILDCEVVAYDRKEKKILPFQVLTHRKRKDVDAADITIQVCIYAFDIIYLNGKSLLRETFEHRRHLLHTNFIHTPGKFHFADYKDTADPEAIAEFLNLAVEQSCEGLMVKTLVQDATYEPSKRSLNWLKCKKDYLDGCGDSLDLVVMGAYHGVGKRTGWYGSFLVGCYNPDDDCYQTTCKLGTGFKDEDLKKHFDSLSQVVVPNKPMEYEINDTFKCDVWFKPVQVWEIKCADLSISPVHTAGIGLAHDEKGIGLRFPRFIRNRDDKKIEQATTCEQVHEFYRNQSVIQNNQGRKF